MSNSALAAGLRHLRRQLAAQQLYENSDEQLLQAFAACRDESAFAVLVRRHGPMVLHVCRRVLGHEQDAEDAFQATFLVLAQSAATLRKKSALASFLHGTAYRLALSAKRAAARRRKHESRAPARPSVNPADDLSWREVRALLDEEIARLPEIYRSAFILCGLEDLSRAEAAQRLGVNENTLSSRLAEARKRLSQRLARRGVELTAVLAAATLATQAASALPPLLASAHAVHLAKNAATALTLSKMKLAAAALAIGLLGGAGVWLASPQVSIKARSASEGSSFDYASGSEKRETAKTLEIQGRVLDPQGKAKAGAKLSLLDIKGNFMQLGVTAADGRFRVTVAGRAAKSRVYHWLVAQADDAALDFLELFQWKGEKPVELRLAKDHPIRGRIVNTEGKPVRGVRVAVESIDVPTVSSLDDFLIVWKKRSFGSSIGCEKHFRTDGDSPLMTTTDADGRFILHGAGVERVVTLRLGGAGIAGEERCIINRPAFDPEPYNQAARDKIPKGEQPYPMWFLHGPNVSVVVEAEKPVHGVVTDADSGKPLPGVKVGCFSQTAKTDAAGRYQIHGVSKAKSYTISAASDPATGYMASQVSTADTAGYQPIRADLRVKKGVIITGKVIDEATDKSVPGYAAAAVLTDNPFVKKYPEMSSYSLRGDREYTAGDGAFRIVALPGPVLLMVDFDYTQSTGDFAEGKKYADPIPDPKYPQYFDKSREWPLYHVFGGGVSPVQGHFCKVLEIKPGTAIIHQDAVLRRTSALTVKIEDAEGRPVRGAWATGIGSLGSQPVEIHEATCSAYGVKPGKPRHMVFFHTERKIAGTLTLTGNEKQPAVVRLRPMGSIKGRLLDRDGKPLAGVAVDLWYRDSMAHFVHELMFGAEEVVTDAAGAFALDKVVPELAFHLSFHRRKQRFERATKAADRYVEVKPGACHDLGAIELKLASKEEDE